MQTALRNVLEPIFEVRFAPTSYGFRPKRGCKDALRRVQELLDTGHTWVVDADIRKYFDTIPHDRLMAEVEKEVADGRVIALLRGYLKAGIMDGLEELDAGRGDAARGGDIAPVGEHLPPPGGHCHGSSRRRDGALRRRLRDHVSESDGG